MTDVTVIEVVVPAIAVIDVIDQPNTSTIEIPIPGIQGPSSDALTWSNLIFWPNALVGVATVSGVSGSVRTHSRGGITYYRFIPSPYNISLDGFYTVFSSGVLSGLIVTRG